MPVIVNRVRVFAPAKFNWILTVRGRRPDGYHDLDTVFQALDWGDELLVDRTPRSICRIVCDRPDVPLGDGNLIARAWRLLCSEYPNHVGGIAVRLMKRIPIGAGLGGGSSDAVAALRAIDRLYCLHLSADRMETLAARLGSDCAFFVRGGTALAAGRGECLTPLANRLSPLWLVVVWPGFASPTAAAFRRLRPRHFRPADEARRLARAIERGRLHEVQNSLANVFSGLVSRSDLRYKMMQDHIVREQLRYPLMAGSGSAMVAFAENRAHARRAADRLEIHYPVVRVVGLRRVGVRVLPAAP
jgi:4-diphosphocytidyl-2-C-methyl-D-erythritol kinase